MLKRAFKIISILLLGVLMGRYLLPFDQNAKPTYGSSGLPKNCRAVIQANIDGFNSHQFSAADALDSIGRNCGRYGYAWSE
jgi:hypothetical protein